jgi:hypothetical protein
LLSSSSGLQVCAIELLLTRLFCFVNVQKKLICLVRVFIWLQTVSNSISSIDVEESQIEITAMKICQQCRDASAPLHFGGSRASINLILRS